MSEFRAPNTNPVLPSSPSDEYLHLYSEFLTDNIHFLTVRGHEAKHQKIDFIDKMLMKVSSHYLIVREKNKKYSEGYHFHAILKLKSQPKPSWFKKGLHINLQRIQKPVSLQPANVTTRYIYDHTCNAKHAIILKNAYASEHFDRTVDRGIQRIPRRTDITKILRYMSKEAYLPVQYTDYIYKKNNKHINLTH